MKLNCRGTSGNGSLAEPLLRGDGKLGEMLKETERAKGELLRGTQKEPPKNAPTLRELKLDKKTSAQIPSRVNLRVVTQRNRP